LLIERDGIRIAINPVRVDEDGGTEFGYEFYPDEQLRFGFCHVGLMVEGAQKIAEEIQHSNAQAIFVYSCSSRKWVFGEDIRLELLPLSDLAPSAGFFCYGELFSSRPGKTRLLAQTMTVLSLAESDGEAAAPVDMGERDVSDFLGQASRQFPTLQVLHNLIETITGELEAERAKSEQLLLNILPRKIMDDLQQFGRSTPETFENVTILFSDFVGFTEMTAEFEPQVVIDELNDLFTRFDEIMETHQCERIKTSGDAYLAVCGMPQPNETHAQNMIRAALEIITYLEERNQSREIEWQIRIGIHSGSAVGGIVGVKKYIYDVFGDAINTASRMEHHSEAMKVNVSSATYQLARNDFVFTERAAIPIKGKSEMRMYFVNAA
jgi:class 3 adenylate cyclase